MFYPTISDDSIATLKLAQSFLTKEGPEWLNKKECPYGELVKTFLRDSMGVGEVVDLFENADDEPEVLDRQIQKVLNKMDAMENQLASLEPNEKLAFFKTRTALLEKLITLREKVTNLREMSEFKGTVVKGLEDICTREQILQFMERIKGY